VTGLEAKCNQRLLRLTSDWVRRWGQKSGSGLSEGDLALVKGDEPWLQPEWVALFVILRGSASDADIPLRLQEMDKEV
jgi:hypothetical protein